MPGSRDQPDFQSIARDGDRMLVRSSFPSRRTPTNDAAQEMASQAKRGVNDHPLATQLATGSGAIGPAHLEAMRDDFTKLLSLLPYFCRPITVVRETAVWAKK